MAQHRAAILAAVIVFVLVTSILALISVPYALIFGAAIFVVVVFFFKPFFGLLIFLALLYIRPQDFIPEFGRMRIVLFLAIIIILFYFVHKMSRREPIHLFSTRQHVLMFLLLALVPASQIANGQFGAAADAAQEFLTVFLLFFILANIPSSFREFRAACWMLFACTTLIAIDGIVQHFRGIDLVGQTPILGRIRWIGIFGDPNEFALLLDSFFPFALVNVFDKQMRPANRLFFALVGIVLFFAIYYTNSRGGFIALLAILVIFAYKRWGLLRGFALGALFLIVGLLVAPSRMAEMDAHEVSAFGRINAWITGLALWKSHPILGIGYHNFQVHNGGIAAHSAAVECFSELGTLGYVVWMTILYSAIAGLIAFEKRFPSSPYRKYVGILQLSFAGFVGAALFLSMAYSPVLYILVALATLIMKSETTAVIQPRLVSPGEAVRILMLVAGSIIGYQIIALVYS
jgi:putative inorganic carbon (HCO3(-)) transporter